MLELRLNLTNSKKLHSYQNNKILSIRSLFLTVHFLKVGGNEKNGRSGRSQMLDNGLGPWQSRFVFNLNMQFWIKMSYFLFRL
jgi:hypothetical protein